MQPVAASNSPRSPLGRHHRLERHRNPEIESEADQRADKSRRRDADDRDLDMVERHTASDNARIAAETPLPEAMANDGDRGGFPLFLGTQGAPQRRAHPERVEIISRYHQAPDRLAL